MHVLQIGVKVLLTDSSGNLLLLKRSKQKYASVADPWDIVGGHIDPGIGLEENLRREVAEETGLELAGVPIFAAAQDIMPTDELHVVRLTYVAQASGTDVRLSDEHIGYHWFRPTELVGLDGLDPYFAAVLSDVLRVLTANGFASNGFTTNSNGSTVDAERGFQQAKYKDQGRTLPDSHLEQKGQKGREVKAENGKGRLDEKFVKSEIEIKAGEGGGNNREIERSASGAVRNTGAIGRLGEDIACRYLTERGFSIRGRNYRKKWGEIDVIAKREGCLHFVEVKAGNSISRGTGYRPEEHVHPKKIERLHRAIQTYLAEHKMEDHDWQLDVLAVDIEEGRKEARCRFIENVI